MKREKASLIWYDVTLFLFQRKDKKLKTKNKKRRSDAQALNATSSTAAGGAAGSGGPSTASSGVGDTPKISSAIKEQPAAIKFPEIKGSGVFLRSSKVDSCHFVCFFSNVMVQQMQSDCDVF